MSLFHSRAQIKCSRPKNGRIRRMGADEITVVAVLEAFYAPVPGRHADTQTLLLPLQVSVVPLSWVAQTLLWDLRGGEKLEAQGWRAIYEHVQTTTGCQT
jgi:hypothetical protein